MASSQHPSNPFLRLSFVEFLAVQMLVAAFFPVSLVVCLLAFGMETTRDLIAALIQDWWQTLIVMVTVFLLVVGGLVYGLIAWLS